MLLHLGLHGVGPIAEGTFEPGSRTTLITGDNGVGKSFLLDLSWFALTRTWSASPAMPRPDASSPSLTATVATNTSQSERRYEWTPDRQQWATGAGNPANPGAVIYARVDGGFSVWDPLRNPEEETPERAARVFSFTRDAVWSGLEVGDRTVCRGLVEDLLTWQLRSNEEFADLTNVLEALAPSHEVLRIADEPMRLPGGDVRDIPTLQTSYGVVSVLHASAAVRRVLALAYLITWAWSEHRRAAAAQQVEPVKRLVLLVDEIESHLHPKWQWHILPALRAIVDRLHERTDVQVICTTHSPIVAASMDGLVDPQRDRLYLLGAAEANESLGATDSDAAHQVVIEQQEWEPRSDAAAWLGSPSFGQVSTVSDVVSDALERISTAVEVEDSASAVEAFSQLTELVAFDDADAQRVGHALRARGWIE